MRKHQVQSLNPTYLGEDQAVLEVDVLSLDITSDGIGGRVLNTGNLESNVGRSKSLDLERCTLDRVVLKKKVRCGLPEVLRHISVASFLRRVGYFGQCVETHFP